MGSGTPHPAPLQLLPEPPPHPHVSPEGEGCQGGSSECHRRAGGTWDTPSVSCAFPTGTSPPLPHPPVPSPGPGGLLSPWGHDWGLVSSCHLLGGRTGAGRANRPPLRGAGVQTRVCLCKDELAHVDVSARVSVRAHACTHIGVHTHALLCPPPRGTRHGAPPCTHTHTR